MSWPLDGSRPESSDVTTLVTESATRMKVTGFTICRNAIRFGYPLKESLQSLLPLVDELVVGVGDSDDGTWELIHSIGDSKIAAFRTVWDMSRREAGILLSEQTNIALARCTGDWAVYLQADEVLHEGDLGRIRGQLEHHLNLATEGLSFKYVHFYGSYGTVQDNWCQWYRREVRAVKIGRGVVSVGDAAGFKVDDGGRMRRLIRADARGSVYHYGWVRPPEVMVAKRQHIGHLYDSAEPEPAQTKPSTAYERLGHLKRFTGIHPSVMARLVAGQDWQFEARFETQAPDWLRHVRLLVSCPKSFLRIVVSRMILAWNTHVPVPKLR